MIQVQVVDTNLLLKLPSLEVGSRRQQQVVVQGRPRRLPVVNTPPMHRQTPVNTPPMRHQTPVNTPPMRRQTPVNTPPMRRQTPVNTPPMRHQTPVNTPPMRHQTPVNTRKDWRLLVYRCSLSGLPIANNSLELKQRAMGSWVRVKLETIYVGNCTLLDQSKVILGEFL
jgi:hypothetical protein